MQEASKSELVSELAKEFLERCRKGKRPALSEYTDRHPGLADQIREVFPMMLLMEDVAPDNETHGLLPVMDLQRLGDFKIHQVIGRGGMGIVYEATQESLGRRVALKVCPLAPYVSSRNQERFRRESRAAAMLHHTNIVPVFAVGEEEGMLYYAMQYIRGATLDDVIQELRQIWRSTPVATTRLAAGVRAQPPGSSTVSSKDRGSNASQVAMSLSGIVQNQECHPRSSDPQTSAADSATDAGLVSAVDDELKASIYSLGGIQPVSDISLPGQSSGCSSDGRVSAKYWESVGRIGVQVAEALAYAHEKGTLHRDIKPSNLMLDHAGVVWVMDFGLAKSLEEDDLTRDGELIGTLRYMAPEQAIGSPTQLSDVYSLGLTLYELLTLRPAFDAVNRSALLKSIATSEPIAPRRINSSLPRDLETIVLKSIEREPSRRYADARSLADDLSRFLSGDPIRARPVSTTDRVGKWIRRRPMVASLLTALAILLVTSFGIVSWKWRDAEVSRVSALDNERRAIRAAVAEKLAREEADLQTALAQERLGDTQEALYRSAISRTEATSQSAPGTANKFLASLVPKAGEVDRRDWEWGYLNNLVNQELAVLQAGAPEAEWIRALAFSHDGKLLATGAARTGFTLPRDRSPRGRATIWNVQTGEIVTELPIEHSAISLAFSRDNKRIAVCEAVAIGLLPHTWDSQTKIWDLEAGKVVATLDIAPPKSEAPPGGQTNALHFSQDDQTIIGTIWSRNRTPVGTSVWDANSGETLWTLDHSELVEYLPGMDSFLVARHTKTGHQVVRISSETHQELEVIRDTTGFYVLPTAKFELGARLPNASARLFFRDYETQQRTLLWGDDGYKVNLDRRSRPVFAANPSEPSFAVGATDGTVRIWNSETRSLQRVLRGHSIDIQSLAYSPSGRKLASGDWSGEVRIWQPDVLAHQTNCRPRSTKPGQCLLEDIAFRFDSSNLIGYADVGPGNRLFGMATAWDIESGMRLNDFRLPSTRMAMGLRQVKFDTSGLRMAIIGRDKNIRVIEVESGEELFLIDATETESSEIAISGNGEIVAATFHSSQSKMKSKLMVWNVKSGESLVDLRGHYRTLALDHLGKQLASGYITQDGDMQVRMCNLDQGADSELRSLRIVPPRGQRITAIAFSNSGAQLATCSRAGKLTIFETATGIASVDSVSVPTGIEDIAWHPADVRLAGANREEVVLWDVQGNEILKLRSAPRSRDMPFDPAVAFSPDGSKLAATQWDNSVTVWTSTRPYEIAPHVTATSTRRISRMTYAIETIERTVQAAPRDPWYLAARGQLGSRLRSAEDTLADYVTARKMLTGDDRCLLIQGDAYIQTPSLPLHEFDEGHTFEAWIKHWNYIQPGCTYGVIAAQYPSSPTEFFERQLHSTGYQLDYWGWYWLRPTDDYYDVCKQWSHVAVVFTPNGQRYYLNGKFLGKNPSVKFAEGMGDFYIGDTEFHNPNVKGRGLLRSVRVSRSARYDSDFMPAKILDSDESTVLLFDFTEDDGVRGNDPSHITDRSSNQNHGTLHNAWWLD